MPVTADPRLGPILEQILLLSSGQLEARGVVSDAGDEIDAIAAGLNMLAEDFADRERQRAEAQERRSFAEGEQGRLTREATALERSNSALSEFAMVASHDLQEPLRMVVSYTDLLEQRYAGQLGPDGAKYLHFAADGARRMQELIRDLLAYCRVGAATLAVAKVDTREVAVGALRDLGAAIAATDAEVCIGELPILLGDARQLHSLFQNLLSNAIKYRSEDNPKISIDAEPRDDGFCFSVADNGIGVEPRFAQRIFEMFQRLHGRRQYEGTGIGLSLCRKVVEAHGGRIWVEPGVPRGAVFRFTLAIR